MTNTPRDFVRIFTATPAPFVFIAATALLLCSVFFALPAVFAYVGAMLSFAAYDAVGFHFVLGQRDGDARAYYRVTQAVWQVVVTCIAWHVDPLAAGLFVASWWAGACDLLYYLLLREDFTAYNPMTWLAWTFPVFLPNCAIDSWNELRGKHYAHIEASPRGLIVWSVVSVIISLSWLIAY